MTPEYFLSLCRFSGIQVQVQAGKLIMRGKGLPAELKAYASEHKAAIIARLEMLPSGAASSPEATAILPAETAPPVRPNASPSPGKTCSPSSPSSPLTEVMDPARRLFIHLPRGDILEHPLGEPFPEDAIYWTQEGDKGPGAWRPIPAGLKRRAEWEKSEKAGGQQKPTRQMQRPGRSDQQGLFGE